MFKLRRGGRGSKRERITTHLTHAGKSIGLVILTAIPLACALTTYSTIFSFANLGTIHLAPTIDEKDALAIGERAGVYIGFSPSSLSGAS